MSFFYEDCFPFTDQNKPDPITILPLSTSLFHSINDQFDDFSMESSTDHTTDESSITNSTPSTSHPITLDL